MKANVLIILEVKILLGIVLFYYMQSVSAKITEEASDDNFLIIDSCISQISVEGEGYLILQNKSCVIHNIEIQLNNKQSILQLIPVVIKQNSTKYQNESTEIENNKQISIDFYELSLLEHSSHSSKIPIKLSNWTFRNLMEIDNKKYLSRTPFLTTEITVEGDWTELNFGFVYQELKFESKEFSYREPKGVIMQNSPYTPNSVSVYQLFKPKDMNKSSIDITVSYINIDDGVGEYLLLGAGSEPFLGEPPLFLFGRSSPKKYHVNSDDAYIVFVSRSTRNQTGGFRISWQYTGTKIMPDEDDSDTITPEDVLQSIPVCIYNLTAASEEFKKTNKDKMFEDFRISLADIANKYAASSNLPAKNFYLKSSSVELFRVTGYISSNEFPDDPSYSALYMMLKIQGPEKGKAAFTWKQLEKIFEIYLEQESNKTDAFGYKVKKCPADGDYSLWWRIGIYATIPLFCCFFIAVWAWKNNHFAKYCSYEQKTESQDNLFDSENTFYADNAKQEKVSQSVNSPIEENQYVRGPRQSTMPPVNLMSEKASSYIGVVETFEENLDHPEVFNKMSIRSENSDRIRTQPRSSGNSPQNTQSHRRSFYNAGESNKSASVKDLNKTQKRENETEHFYDSVASSIKMKKHSQLKETFL